MKFLATMCLLLGIVLLSFVPVLAQVTGDYQSNGTGNWSDHTKWQTYNGSGWVAAGVAPTGSGTITIQGSDSLYLDVSVTITGTLKMTGGKLGNSLLTLTFGPGSVYEHAFDAGSVPAATWDSTSTVRITATAAAGPQFPSDREYGNLEFSSHLMTGNVQLNMTGTSLTFKGNFTVGPTVNIGGTVSQLRLSGSSATFPSLYRTYHIGGDLIVDSDSAIFTFCGSSNLNTGDSVYVGGAVRVNKGIFRINAGSGSSGWMWCNGDFLIAAGAQLTKHSSTTYPVFVHFSKAGRQSFVNDGTISTGFAKCIDMIVDSGSVFNTGSSHVTGGANFTLKSGATLETARDGGVDSAIATNNGSGTSVVRTFEPGSSYIFDGSTPQVTGALMPASVRDLTINNPAGVALTQGTSITDTLRLQAGVFDNTTPFTLESGAGVSYEGGSLLIPLAVKSDPSTVPHVFYVDQNFPNPFNPSTTIKFGLPHAAYTTVKVFSLLGQEIAVLFEGNLIPGVHEIPYNPANLNSGVYFYRVQAGNSVIIKRMILIK